MRVKIFHLFAGIGFIVLALGLLYLQVIRGGYYYNLSERNCIRIIPELACRGRIFDRSGQILADSHLAFNVNFIPQELQDKTQAFNAVSKLLGREKYELIARYHKNYNLAFAPVPVARNIGKEKAIMLSAKNLDLPGVVVELQPQRRYPEGLTAAHILGYLAEIDRRRLESLGVYGYKIRDIIGYSGIEGYLDYYLRGKDGGKQVQIDSRGRISRVLGISAPQDGKDVTLTINLKMQKVCDEFLQNKRGAIVILEPYSGQILAMANSPGFDPGMFIRGDRRAVAGILNSKRSPLLNRATSQAYPPGSIFKLVVALAALDSNKTSRFRTFLCNGSAKIGSGTFDCWDTHNIQDLNGAITHSCNVYFYNLGLLAGADRLAEYASKLGLGKPTDIEFFSEVNGFIPTRLWKKIAKHENWYDGDTANFAIGQGYVLITPLQAARMIAVFANGGYLVTPHILRSVDNKEVLHPKAQKLNINLNNIEIINAGLRAVVEDDSGTAHLLAELKLKVAGKTGTAQVQNKLAHGWFIGFAPYDQPKIAFCILLENVGSSAVSVSVLKNILAKFKEEDLF